MDRSNMEIAQFFMALIGIVLSIWMTRDCVRDRQWARDPLNEPHLNGFKNLFTFERLTLVVGILGLQLFIAVSSMYTLSRLTDDGHDEWEHVSGLRGTVISFGLFALTVFQRVVRQKLYSLDKKHATERMTGGEETEEGERPNRS